jgi:hypothetical protein
MNYKFAGVVTYVSPVEKFGMGKESKRIIVESGEKYPNFFPVTFYGDKMSAIDSVKVGDYVEVDTFPGGRLKKGDDSQAFCYLNGWKCDVVPTGQTAPAPAQSQEAPVQMTPSQQKFMDDIPF